MLLTSIIIGVCTLTLTIIVIGVLNMSLKNEIIEVQVNNKRAFGNWINVEIKKNFNFKKYILFLNTV